MMTACPEVDVLLGRAWSTDTSTHVADCGSCRLVMELIEERAQAAESQDRRAQCAKYEALIAVRIGGPLGGTAARMLDEHLHDCEACRAIAETMAPANDPIADHAELPAVDPRSYALGPEVARGGMGRILSARDLRIGRPVAVKELLAKTSSMAARFEREARVTARLQHPGIVPIYEIGKFDNGTPFYAMRMVEGDTLRTKLRKAETLDARLALLPAVIAATEAVAFAHAAKVIHRDLTPANIMVGDYGETVVIDWGLAKDLANEVEDEIDAGPYRRDPTTSDLTAAGAVIGTAAYMPPEQASGQRVDPRADVYALGAILYHLLAGHAPYTGKDALAQATASDPAPLPTTTPRDLVSIVAKAMARDPNDRYATARELAAELTAFQAGRLVSAHEYTRGELLRRWIRKRRGIVAVVAIAAIALGAFGTFAIRRILDERDRAEAGELESQTQRASAEAAAALLLEESGRQELLNGNSTRAAVWLSASYSAGNDRPSLRLLLARAMRDLEAYERTLECGDAVQSLELSSDETHVLASCRNQVKIWNVSDGTLVRTFEASNAQALHARYSLDGTSVLAWGAGDNMARVWDAKTGALRFELRGHTDKISSAVVDRQNRRVLTASFDGTVRLWNATDGALERTIVAAPAQQGLRAVFIADGATLASATKDGVIQIWDSENGNQLRTIENGAQIVGGDFRDRRTAETVVCGADGVARIWDFATGKLVGSFPGHVGLTWTCTLSHNGRRLLTVGTDGFGKIWDVTTGHLLATLVHGGVVRAGAFSRDDTRVVTGGSAGIKVWQTDTGALLGADENHNSDPGRLQFAGDRVLAADENGVRIWNRLGGDWLRMFRGGDGHVKDGSRDGRHAIVERGGAIEIWDVERNARIEHVALRPPFVITDDRLVARSSDGIVVVDLRSGRSEQTIGAKSIGLDPGLDLELKVSSNGKRLITTMTTTLSTEVRSIRAVVLDVASGRELVRFDAARGFAITGDGARIVIGRGSRFANEVAELWDVSPARRIRTFDLGIGVRAADLDPTASRLIVASAAPNTWLANLTIWDTERGTQIQSVPNVVFWNGNQARDLLIFGWIEQVVVQRLSDGSEVMRIPVPAVGTFVDVHANGELVGVGRALASKIEVTDAAGRLLVALPFRPAWELGQDNLNVGQGGIAFLGDELNLLAGNDLFWVRLDGERRAPAVVAEIVEQRARFRLDAGRLVQRPQPLAVLTGRITRKQQLVGDGTLRALGDDGNAFASTVTAADGTYRLILGPGTIRVMAGSPAAFARPRPVTLNEGENRLDIELDLAGSIAGLVVDAAGRPVGGVAVHADCTGCLQEDSGDDITRADGKFELRALSGGGIYALRMVRDGREVHAQETPSIGVKDGNDRVSGVRIQLAP